MSDPFIGEIKMVGFNFAPRGWANCDGQLLAISQNTALFSLLGTTFGGDGRTTFALPDLRGRIAKHVGTGPGLANVRWGERSGHESETLTVLNIPSHSHLATHALTAKPGASSEDANSDDPTGAYLAANDGNLYHGTADEAMGAGAVEGTITIGQTGGGQSFDIRNPYLGVYHCIAMVGIYPSRN